MTTANIDGKTSDAVESTDFFPDNEFIEALSKHVENEVINDFDKKLGNNFLAFLGGDFIDDLRRTITGKVEIIDHSTITVKCVNGKILTFVIKPKEQCIEAIFPELDTTAKKGKIEMKRTSRSGVLRPKYSNIWKSFITLTYAKYNVAA